MRSVVLWLLVGLSLPAMVLAQPVPVDTDSAARLFNEGRLRYEVGDWEGARVRWEAARQLRPLPELDYDIGRCWERLGRAEEAIREYRKYLATVPNAPNAATVRARLAALEPAAPGPGGPVAAPAPSRRRQLLVPIVVGGAALVTAIVGSALVGSVAPEYDRLRAECQGACMPERWSGLEARADAGYALWTVAGALAVADAVLWVIAVRHGHGGGGAHALVPSGGSGASVDVRF